MNIVSNFVCLLILAGCVAVPAANAATKPLTVDIKNPPPGEHSLHIHQFAKCEAPDFKSAGSHFNPSSASQGDHAGHAGLPAGDIPDFALIVAADGTAHATVVAPNVTLGADD